MLELDIKRGWFKHIEGDQLEQLMTDTFGTVEKDDDKLLAYFGAMQPIRVWVRSKKTLCVDISTDTDVDEEMAMETIRAKNKFLEAATGFNAKKRTQRLKKKLKEGKA